MDDGPGAGSLDLRTLRTFLAVVEEGGMTAAGARLGLTQSSVSQTMARLARSWRSAPSACWPTPGRCPAPRGMQRTSLVRRGCSWASWTRSPAPPGRA